MKILKRLLILLCVFILSTNITVLAEGVAKITFDGNTKDFKMDEDIFNINFNDVLPGDILEKSVDLELKNIKDETRVYLEIKSDNVNIPEDISFRVLANDEVILDGVNTSLEPYLLIDTKKDSLINFKIQIEVPTSIGNEVKNLDKDNIWSFIIEDESGKHHIPDTSDSNNNGLYSILFGLSLICSIYLLFISKKYKSIN